MEWKPRVIQRWELRGAHNVLLGLVAQTEDGSMFEACVLRRGEALGTFLGSFSSPELAMQEVADEIKRRSR